MTATMTATAVKPGAPKVSARAHLKEWVRKQVEGKGEVRAPDVTVGALQTFGTDQNFLADLGRETLKTTVYELVLDVIGEGRQEMGDIDVLPVGSIVSPNGSTDSRAALKSRLALLTARYSRWMEYVGDGHVNLLKLTAETCRKAIEIRRERGDHEHRIADFLSVLAGRIRAGKTIGDSIDLEQIDALRREKMEPAKEQTDGDL